MKDNLANTQPDDGAEPELLTMDEAIERLKTTRATLSRWLKSGQIRGMKVGRQWRFYPGDIERFLRGQEPRIEVSGDLAPLRNTLMGRLRDMGEEGPLPVDVDDTATGVVNLMIYLAWRMNASDIHLQADTHDGQDRFGLLRFRIDGVLHEITIFDHRLLGGLVGRWKTMAAVDAGEHTLPQDGRMILDIQNRQLDLRVCFFPAHLGESVTARLLRADAVNLGLDHLGFSKPDLDRLKKAIHEPWGLIVLSGPTGSGKTTALYSCLNEMSDRGLKIMSVEDPVEYLLPGVVQTAIKEQLGLDFTRAARAMLRSDPDVLMIGEIRNFDSAMICVQAALTGHLVLTNLHTENATNTLRRLLDIGVPDFVVADAVKLAVSQRLVRRLCDDCKRPTEPTEADLARAKQLTGEINLEWDTLERNFHEPVGCSKCALGYLGRFVIAESIAVCGELAKSIRNHANAEELRSTAIEQGMQTLAADGILRAARGQTTLREVFRVLAL